MKQKYKHQAKRKIPVFFMVFLLTLCVIGCGNNGNAYESSFYERANGQTESFGNDAAAKADRIYQEAMERLMEEDDTEQMEGKNIFDKLARKLLLGYRRTYNVLRSLSPAICTVSVSIGVLMMVFSMHNKQTKRLGLFAFIIGIPFTVLFIVFGIGIFHGILLY